MTKKELLDKCEKLTGKTLRELLDPKILSNNKNNKGNFGNAIELYFGLKNSSISKPDLMDLGIEIKTSSLRMLKKNSNEFICYRPKERVKLLTINYFEIINETNFKKSHLYEKCHKMLFIFYLYDDSKEYQDYKIINYIFYDLDHDCDFNIIEKEYYLIKKMIYDGLANELSEKMTEYLGACPCGDGQKKVKQPHSSKLASKRAFSFKTKQISKILNDINFTNVIEMEKDLRQKVKRYEKIGIDELFSILGIKNKNYKKIKSEIICKILNVNSYEEYLSKFKISKILIKNVTLNNKNKLKEEIGLINVNFNEFMSIKYFKESELYEFLDRLTIIFIVWKENKDKQEYIDEIKSYTIDKNLINCARIVWENTRELFLNSNCIKEIKNNKYYYNFIKKRDNQFFHIRPHDSKRVDRIMMPNGEYICNFQYWLNKEFFK